MKGALCGAPPPHVKIEGTLCAPDAVLHNSRGDRGGREQAQRVEGDVANTKRADAMGDETGEGGPGF